jgi:hypothetical protein
MDYEVGIEWAGAANVLIRVIYADLHKCYADVSLASSICTGHSDANAWRRAEGDLPPDRPSIFTSGLHKAAGFFVTG